MTLDKRYDVSILVKRRPELILLLARLHDVCNCRDAHLSHSCVVIEIIQSMIFKWNKNILSSYFIIVEKDVNSYTLDSS